MGTISLSSSLLSLFTADSEQRRWRSITLAWGLAAEVWGLAAGDLHSHLAR